MKDNSNDYYVNGGYSIWATNTFIKIKFKSNDTEVAKHLHITHSLVFKPTEDGLYLGTGWSSGTYKYVVVAPPYGVSVILESERNDKGFSSYSARLLSLIRDYRRSGKKITYPFTFQK